MKCTAISLTSLAHKSNMINLARDIWWMWHVIHDVCDNNLYWVLGVWYMCVCVYVCVYGDNQIFPFATSNLADFSLQDSSRLKVSINQLLQPIIWFNESTPISHPLLIQVTISNIILRTEQLWLVILSKKSLSKPYIQTINCRRSHYTYIYIYIYMQRDIYIYIYIYI